MASRVNVKFVALLSAVLLVLFGGVTYSAYALLLKSASDHAKAGKEAGEKGDWSTAEMHYSKAVSKEQNNAEYIHAWRDALEHIVPAKPVEFNDKLQRWFGASRQLGVVQRDNVAAQAEYLESRRRVWLTGAFNRQACEQMVSECDAFLSFHAAKGAGQWDTLRRYRGLARLKLLAETPDARESAWTDCRADFEAALKANPKDGQSAVGLEALLMGLSTRAERNNDPAASAEYEKAAGEVFKSYLAGNPEDTQVQLGVMRREMARAIAEFQSANKALVDAGKPGLDPNEAGRKFAESAKGSYDAAWAGATKADAKTFDLDLIQGLRGMEATMEPATSPARTQELVRRLTEANPTSADLISLRADLLSQQENYADAVTQLKAILDLPPMPVGIDGSRLFAQKSQARFFQAMWSLRDAVRQTKEEDRKPAAARAKEYCTALSANEAEDSPGVRLTEAWMAFVEGDMERADRLFDNIMKTQQGLDVDSMLVWAQVAVRRQQPGAARDRLMTALRAQPQNLNATIALGELHISLNEYEQAKGVYTALVRLYPERKDFKDRLAQIESVIDPSKSASVTDPVVRLLLEAEGMSKKGVTDANVDTKVAEMLAAKLSEHNWDPRLVQALAMVYRRIGQLDKAGLVVSEASAKHPDNKNLKSLASALSEKDEYAMRRKLIELSDAPAMEKALARYQNAKEFDRADDLKAAMDELSSLGADEVRVIEVQFIEALEKRDLARAEELATAATKVNADKYEGRTFKARLMAAKADYKGAVDMMQEVVNTGGAQPEAFRLLGRFQIAMGRIEDGVANYRVALARRPNDMEGLKDLMRGLIQLQRPTEALGVARGASLQAQSDREFEDVWLRLEQQVGDANLARLRRERIAQGRPNDRENLLALGDIYLRLNESEKASQVSAKVKELGVDMDAVALEAAVLWAGNKRDAAKAALSAFAEGRPDPKAKLEANIGGARFLYTRNDLEGAQALLEKAREYQDPKVMEADKAISDLFIYSGNADRALEALRRIVTSGGDTPDSQYRKRLVESLLTQGKYAEAETELTPLLKVASPDYVSVLLSASVRGGLNDAPGQRRILDDAVSRFPKEPAVFIRRGQFLTGKDDTLRDAVADFSQAAMLAPNMWQTYRLRAGAYAKIRDAQGNPIEQDKALDDLKRALSLNPFDNDLLVGLVSDLVRLGRDQEAQRAVEEAVKARPRDAIVFVQMGNLFAGAGRLTIAQDFFDQAFALDPADGVAQRLMDALLDPRQPNIAKAEEVLKTLGTDRVSKNPGFLMGMAKVRTAQNRKVEANKFVLDAVKLLDPKRDNLMLIWHQDMRRLQPDRVQHIKFLEAAINQGAVGGSSDWLGHFRAALMVEGDDTFDEGMKSLDLLAKGGKPDIIRLLSWRLMGGMHYAKGKSEQAEKVWREGLAAFPNDSELNNNLAYILAVDLKRPAESIPFATKAKEVDPENADIADTLAFALFKSGKVTEAIDVYTEAIDKNRIRTARTGVHMLSHLAEALLELSKQAPTPEERTRQVNRAKDYLRMAESIIGQPNVPVDDSTKKEYQRVRELVGQ